MYKNKNGHVVFKQWEITTDPGLKTLKAPLNSKGTAILQAGQYIDTYKLGKHKNTYTALVQTEGKVTVHRDNNKDAKLDLTSQLDTGFFGINIHKAGMDSIQVDGWSAGCQVFKRASDFEEFIRICKQSGQQTFTYTLFSE